MLSTGRGRRGAASGALLATVGLVSACTSSGAPAVEASGTGAKSEVSAEEREKVTLESRWRIIHVTDTRREDCLTR